MGSVANMRKSPIGKFRKLDGPPGIIDGAYTFAESRGILLNVIASAGDSDYPWEHVSVSVVGSLRCPTWAEMCHIKKAFWHDSETVVQFHPRRSEYVNNHEFVLHLWRHWGGHILPPKELV